MSLRYERKLSTGCVKSQFEQSLNVQVSKSHEITLSKKIKEMFVQMLENKEMPILILLLKQPVRNLSED